ncbi:uncharacterized [Tachysurus ichikawai]
MRKMAFRCRAQPGNAQHVTEKSGAAYYSVDTQSMLQFSPEFKQHCTTVTAHKSVWAPAASSGWRAVKGVCSVLLGEMI